MKPDSLASIMNWSKNLYVFMLSAVIVMSGCFGTGSTDGDEGSMPNSPLTNNQTNEPPVAYWTVDKITYDHVHYNSSTGQELLTRYTTFGWHISAIDFDGNISSVGIDFNLDGMIEIPFTSNNWSEFSYQEGPVNLTFADADMVPSDNYCYWRMNLIVIDDDGGKFINPITLRGTGLSGCQETRAA